MDFTTVSQKCNPATAASVLTSGECLEDFIHLVGGTLISVELMMHRYGTHIA